MRNPVPDVYDRRDSPGEIVDGGIYRHQLGKAASDCAMSCDGYKLAFA